MKMNPYPNFKKQMKKEITTGYSTILLIQPYGEVLVL